jgi:ribonuclease R
LQRQRAPRHEASRDVEAWLKCKYMREHLGEEYGGVVSSATSFGIFVTLDAMYVEGLVHITELGGEYFRFDEARQELRGERTGIRYAIGTRVQVQVSRVDLDGRRIDFRLVRDGERLAPRGAGDRSPAFESGQREPASAGVPFQSPKVRSQRGGQSGVKGAMPKTARPSAKALKSGSHSKDKGGKDKGGKPRRRG